MMSPQEMSESVRGGLPPFPLAGEAEPGPERTRTAELLAECAVQALNDEVNLTPKPGLVDRRGSGAHTDLTLDMMVRSARSLRDCFADMAAAAAQGGPLPRLRERLGAIGREGERAMFAATGGCNTHKGAIWALGLLTAGAVLCGPGEAAERVACAAGAIARHPDSRAPRGETNGSRAVRRYGAGGARAQACANFPHVIRFGLPTLRAARRRGAAEDCARLDALMAIMAELDDTCILHRGGLQALTATRTGAQAVLAAGGTDSAQGRQALMALDRRLLELHVSPGGSGDLIAATLYLDALTTRFTL